MNGDLGQRRGIGGEAFAQRRHVRNLVRRQLIGEDGREFSLAPALMGERQQIDHQPACRPFGKLFEQAVEGLATGIAREDLVTVDKAQKTGESGERLGGLDEADEEFVVPCGDLAPQSD